MLKQLVLVCMGLDCASVDKLRKEMPGAPFLLRNWRVSSKYDGYSEIVIAAA
jgi:hypothetical protein